MTEGTREALGITGLGVMLGGITAAAAMGGKWALTLMVGALFGGLAIMALASRD